ncbi:hypothetical protein FB567DRAFT_331613 [Paraphoma chrysanthemicola]|uniref:Mid2 domain-containing protein n=1 Tax=Paraphoma chrysanthemicola TaxID=798071 RepID=A0A8K0R7W5_9PLEO|nr:hypothetical protein FB567DRAFT_331613 [Paraphoma chrysanthemicola]
MRSTWTRYTTAKWLSYAQILSMALVQADCLHPNGTQTMDLYHAPCSNDTSNPLSTICCAIARPLPPGSYTPGFVSDTCLDSGICQNIRKTSETGTDLAVSYWREECTEKDWRSGKCLTLCVDSVDGGNQQMTPCDGTPQSEKWCCGSSNRCCLTNPLIVPQKFVHAIKGSSSSVAPAASVTSTSSLRSSVTSTAVISSSTASVEDTASSSSSSMGRGAIAGIVVGAIAGIALLLVAGFLIAKRRRNSSAVELQSDYPPEQSYMQEQKTTYAHEVDAVDAQRSEMAGSPLVKYEERKVVQELP